MRRLKTKNKAAENQGISPDLLLGDERVAHCINLVTKDGKKSKAAKIVYCALDLLLQKLLKNRNASEKTVQQILGSLLEGNQEMTEKVSVYHREEAREAAREAFKRVLANVMPRLEVVSRRVGGTTFQVPVEPRKKRQMALAMRWLIQFASKRSEQGMAAKLSAEMYEALLGTGATVRHKETMLKTALSSRTNAIGVTA